ncbi:MAG: tRNA pseudouridine(13) synthase TruD [Desulfurococcaceae archaeon]
MLIYPHPLDYVSGIKYTITNRHLPLEFNLNAETFHVSEIVDLNELGFNKERGEYVVLEIYKKNIEMFKAVSIVSKDLNIPRSNLFFYGIKDKNATTRSYLFIKSKLVDQASLPVIRDNLIVELKGYVKVKPRVSHYRGNKFKVHISNTRSEIINELREIVDYISIIGLPSYYGYQRFGLRRYNTHVLGKYLLLGREDYFSYQLLKSLYPLEDAKPTLSRITGDYGNLLYEKLYITSPVSKASKKILKYLNELFIDAYASYLYNLLLNAIIETRGLQSLNFPIPMPGCTAHRDLYHNIAESEGVDPVLLDKLPCFYRNGLFKPLNNLIYEDKGSLIYEFQLKPGMYASIVLREIFKDRLSIEE